MSTKHTHTHSTSKRKLSRPAGKQFDLIEGRLDRLREWRQKRNAKSGEGDGDGEGEFHSAILPFAALARCVVPRLQTATDCATR